MNHNVLEVLAGVIEHLSTVDLENCSGENLIDLSVKIDENGDLIVVGNSEGLIYLATSIISLVQRQIPGSHLHFDQHSVLDECDMPMIIMLA